MFAIVFIENPAVIHFNSYLLALEMVTEVAMVGVRTGYLVNQVTGEILLSF